MISIIAAMDRNRNIGLDGDMPWGKEMKSDLRRFKELTTGKVVVMGRKTFESLPGPLPNRWHIILTSQNLELPKDFHGRTINNIDALIDALKSTDEEHFVIGGAQIYEQFMPYADKLYITRINAYLEGDVKFPSVIGNWAIVENEVHEKDEHNPYPYVFKTYERV